MQSSNTSAVYSHAGTDSVTLLGTSQSLLYTDTPSTPERGSFPTLPAIPQSLHLLSPWRTLKTAILPEIQHRTFKPRSDVPSAKRYLQSHASKYHTHRSP
jgi:hypothetical protein